MKRIFDLKHNEYFSYSKDDLKACIKISEGRTVMSETVISTMSLLDGVSNPETARAFGADMITLNTFDVYNPFIFGYDDENVNLFGGIASSVTGITEQIVLNRENENYIRDFKERVGRFIGVNLEPVRSDIPYPKGLCLHEESLRMVAKLGFDYIVITANPKTGVTSEDILWGVQEARRILGDSMFIIAGKMHGAGTASVDSLEQLRSFVDNGADCVLIPAPMTVPGVTREFVTSAANAVHQQGGLVMTTTGTSQEGAMSSVVEEIALVSKEAGADIQHIGDAGFSGMALPENIMTLSLAIRGKRHTYRQIARSIKR